MKRNGLNNSSLMGGGFRPLALPGLTLYVVLQFCL